MSHPIAMRIGMVVLLSPVVGVIYWWEKNHPVIQETSPILHESAFVEQLEYAAPSSGFVVTPSLGGGIGEFSFGPGGTGLGLGSGMHLTTTSTPEKFGVVFRCQHGQFTVHKQDVFEKLRAAEGKEVMVDYRETYELSYVIIGDEKKLLERKLIKYDFLGATLK